jgi:hypothetical protein
MPGPSLRCRSRISLVAALLLAACGEPLTAPTTAAPTLETAPFVANLAVLPPDPAPPFSLAINPADLAGSFSFLEPLARGRDDGNRGTSGRSALTFDASLLSVLAVKVCPAASTVCTTPLATLTAVSDLRTDGDQQYKVNWKPEKSSAVRRVRISVEVAGLEVGATTVDSDNRTIPIKFRVNNNAVIRVRALHAQGIDATTLAQALIDEFSLNSTQVATRLFSDPAPFLAIEVGEALHNSTLYAPLSEPARLNETGTVYHRIGVPAYQAGLTLSDLSKDPDPDPAKRAGIVTSVLKAAGYDIAQIAPTISSIFSLGDQGTAELLKLVGFEAGPIGTALHEVFHVTDVGLAAIFKGLGYDAPTILDALILTTGHLDANMKVFMLAMKLAGYGAFEIADALENETFVGHHELAQLMKGVGFAADEIADVLNTVNHIGMIAAAAVLKEIGLTPEDIAGALKTAYGATADGLTVAFKGAGFAAGEVASGLKTAYGFTGDQVAVALKGAGFAADQVASGLQTAYSFSSDQVGVALNGAGYAANEVAGALKDVYNLSASQLTDFFKNTLNLASDAIATALQDAGYVIDEIGDAISDFFEDIGGGFCNAIPIC